MILFVLLLSLKWKTGIKVSRHTRITCIVSHWIHAPIHALPLAAAGKPLALNGRYDVELEAVEINGTQVHAHQKSLYVLTLGICPDDTFELNIVTEIKPHETLPWMA